MFSLDTNFVKDLIQNIAKKDNKVLQCNKYFFTLVTPDDINITCKETHDSWQIEVSNKIVHISLDEKSLSKQELWELSNAIKRSAQIFLINTIINAIKGGAEVLELAGKNGCNVITKDWAASVVDADEGYIRVLFYKESSIDYIFYIESDVLNQIETAKQGVSDV